MLVKWKEIEHEKIFVKIGARDLKVFECLLIVIKNI